MPANEMRARIEFSNGLASLNRRSGFRWRSAEKDAYDDMP
jgi:hypothetical protein